MDGRPLSVMELIKLTYISHGWHLEMYGGPLFHNRIEAWRHGPVIPDVYHAFQSQGLDVRHPVLGQPPPNQREGSWPTGTSLRHLRRLRSLAAFRPDARPGRSLARHHGNRRPFPSYPGQCDQTALRSKACEFTVRTGPWLTKISAFPRIPFRHVLDHLPVATQGKICTSLNSKHCYDSTSKRNCLKSWKSNGWPSGLDSPSQFSWDFFS